MSDFIEADCSLIKRGGKIIGISLIALPHGRAEGFCESFSQELIEGGGDIRFEDGKIVFVNPRVGEASFLISKEDAEELQIVLYSGNELEIYKDGVITPGFKIVLKGMGREGERFPLERA